MFGETLGLHIQYSSEYSVHVIYMEGDSIRSKRADEQNPNLGQQEQ
jgi:hypothetical protein